MILEVVELMLSCLDDKCMFGSAVTKTCEMVLESF